jgi:hypothetical protein
MCQFPNPYAIFYNMNRSNFNKKHFEDFEDLGRFPEKLHRKKFQSMR